MSTVDLHVTSGVLPAGMSDLHSCLAQPFPLLSPLSPARDPRCHHSELAWVTNRHQAYPPQFWRECNCGTSHKFK